jgi:hypothetical protein
MPVRRRRCLNQPEQCLSRVVLAGSGRLLLFAAPARRREACCNMTSNYLSALRHACVFGGGAGLFRQAGVAGIARRGRGDQKRRASIKRPCTRSAHEWRGQAQREPADLVLPSGSHRMNLALSLRCEHQGTAAPPAAACGCMGQYIGCRCADCGRQRRHRGRAGGGAEWSARGYRCGQKPGQNY